MAVPTLSPQLAEENAESVSRLYTALRTAAERAGMGVPELAQAMAVDTDTAEAVLGGRLDLSLSDLQEIALAVDALLTFQVTPSAGDLLLGAHRTVESLPAFTHSQWNDSLDAAKVTLAAMKRARQELNV